MKLQDVQAGQTIKVKMTEGFADAVVLNNSPNNQRIALTIKLGVKGGIKYKDWETVLNYSDRILKDFELLNNIEIKGQRPPNHAK